jgi:hypothetical protein
MHLDFYVPGETYTYILGNNQVFVLQGIKENGDGLKIMFLRGLNQIDQYSDTTAAQRYVDMTLAVAKELAMQNRYNCLLLCPHTEWHPDSNRVENTAYMQVLNKNLPTITFANLLDVAIGDCYVRYAHVVWTDQDLGAVLNVVNPLANYQEEG